METEENLPEITRYQPWPTWDADRYLESWKTSPIMPLADHYAKKGNLEQAVNSGIDAIDKIMTQLEGAKQKMAQGARTSENYFPWFVDCYGLAAKVAICKTTAYCIGVDIKKAVRIMNRLAKPGTTLLDEKDLAQEGIGKKLEFLADTAEKELYQYNLTNWAFSSAYLKTQ